MDGGAESDLSQHVFAGTTLLLLLLLLLLL